MTDAFGWRAIFLLNIPVGIVALAFASTRLSESADPRGRTLDLAGAALLGGGLLMLVFAILRGNREGSGSCRPGSR